jgi:hypothetical protein
MNDVFIKHKDWEGLCYFSNNKIIRKDIDNEIGDYIIKNNKLIILWEKWNKETFFYFDNNSYFYFKDIFEENFSVLNIIDKDNIYLLILNKNINEFIYYLEDNIIKGNYVKDNDILIIDYILNNQSCKNIFKNIITNIYCFVDDFYKNIFFDIKILDNSISENYIFNKITNKFYNSNDIDNTGTFTTYNNSISMIWNNGYNKTYYSHKYSSFDKVKNNVHIIKPTNIIIEDKVLFSNISLCKKYIILSSMHYKHNNWDFNLLEIDITNCNILNKQIIDNDDEYESSATIILELDRYVNHLFLKISYKKIYSYNIYLEQLNIIEHNFASMTLFKDDYFLLKTYLKYYEKLGINIFFLYYNQKIDHILVDEIIKLNESNSIIYIIEWDYIYWWKDISNSKYHHAQLMAINDALNILKIYGNYILFNDLDEYIDNNFVNFDKLIQENLNNDIFIFKNRFCKMGNDLIKYKDFDSKFNLNNIIEGNYYPEFREKNLIKSSNINVMGVHKIFNKFSQKNLKNKIISQFFHFVNFDEKNREFLMTEYLY